MPLHMLKMCVGCDSVDDLREWQENRLLRGEGLFHRTRNMPKRAEEILAGGSLYWIIKGDVRVRQRITGLDPGVDGEGTRFCLIRLHPELVETVRQPRRPMQGWRYPRDGGRAGRSRSASQGRDRADAGADAEGASGARVALNLRPGPRWNSWAGPSTLSGRDAIVPRLFPSAARAGAGAVAGARKLPRAVPSSESA
ncbi:MAG: DUF1489 domain-containing protein [Aliidongia sp.]